MNVIATLLMSMLFTAPFPQKSFLLTIALSAFRISSPEMVSLLNGSSCIVTDSSPQRVQYSIYRQRLPKAQQR